MKLHEKFLAPYLPYKLKGIVQSEIYGGWLPEGATVVLSTTHWGVFQNPKYVKSVMRPMSDLRFKPFRNYDNLIGKEKYTLSELEFLHKNHFDLYNLISQGLAINVNTL